MKDFTPENYLIFQVEEEEDHLKMREFLERKGLSSRFIRRSVRQQDIYLNGKLLSQNKRVKTGDHVYIDLGTEPLNVEPQSRPLEIIYEDEDLLLINKEPHMVTHTAKDDHANTLLNYVGGYFLERGIRRKVRFANRLDRDTSGIIIVAKNSYAHSMVAVQMEDRQLTKRYRAICMGFFQEKEGSITGKIQLGDDGIRREISPQGKEALTEYRVLAERRLEGRSYSLVDLTLHTGRTHQLRVHLSSIGHPIAGDGLYGGEDSLFHRQALHSYYLELIHPRIGKKLEFVAPMPADFKKIFREEDLVND